MRELVAHAAKTRDLCAGTIIGSGTVSNKFEGGEGKKIEDGGVGYSCIAEIRMIEKIQTGEFKTPFMRFGDKVGIEMNDAAGNSIFGRIENNVEKYVVGRRKYFSIYGLGIQFVIISDEFKHLYIVIF